mmetsp:Transcript_71956/g.112666  ORF Transcript_71956/g.112666 Transcript_71956/m.112666 type:complete len:112 (+) Transcript_71956:76-411(+)
MQWMQWQGGAKSRHASHVRKFPIKKLGQSLGCKFIFGDALAEAATLERMSVIPTVGIAPCTDTAILRIETMHPASWVTNWPDIRRGINTLFSRFGLERKSTSYDCNRQTTQ